MTSNHYIHFIIISIIIAIIVVCQFVVFFNTIKKLKVFDKIFSVGTNDYFLLKTLIEKIENGDFDIHKKMLNDYKVDIGSYVYTDIDKDGNVKSMYRRGEVVNLLKSKNPGNENEIRSKHKNPIINTILTSINDYLRENKGSVSDFHLMKDIVDRNCDAAEEEINTQIPIPLYLGLVGTMAGILLGIGYLWISGGLKDLLDSGKGMSGATGIEALLGGVALAMISSIVGILLTTWGSIRAKNAKAEFEKNKHIFLSWIQAKLLPKLTDSIAQTLEKMSHNLVAFNAKFSSNTTELGRALANVNESSRLHSKLLSAVNEIADKNISVKNLELYNALKESSDEIGTLGTYLKDVNSYLQNVRDLNSKLDDYENRTQIIENAGRFFTRNEKWLSENFDRANLEVQESLKRFDEATISSLKGLQDSLDSQTLNFSSALQRQQNTFSDTVAKQQDLMLQKLGEINKLVEEVKNLSAIKESIGKFEHATNEQNKKIADLANSIRELAQAKAIGGEIKVVQKMPRLLKNIALVTGSLVSFTCLAYIIPQIIEWISSLITEIF